MSHGRTVFGVAVVLLATAIFALYAHNSGYGYDALEYLVIGREVARGASLYDFAPSKGPGIYFLVALLDGMVGTLGHMEVALVVAVLAAAIAALTVRVASKFAPTRLAILAGCITWLAAASMEQNFLETEGFVLGSALLALLVVCRSDSVMATGRGGFLAGVSFGIGTLFKAVALAFVPAMMLGLLIFGAAPLGSRIRSVALLCLGVFVPVAFATAVFGSNGAAKAFWHWSFEYPLLQYPGDSDFAPKTLFKCLWMIVLVVGLAIHVGIQRGALRRVMGDGVFVTLLCMSAFALLPMIKSQASHYAFPAAGCLALLIARGLALVPLGAGMPRLATGVLACAVAAIVAGAIARPDVARRFHQWRDFELDRQVSQAIANADSTGGPILALDQTGYMLQVSGRAALPTALVNTHAQPADLFRRNPQLLRDAIANPSLEVIVWDPATWKPDHASFVLPAIADGDFRDSVERNFIRFDSGVPGLVIWRRR